MPRTDLSLQNLKKRPAFISINTRSKPLHKQQVNPRPSILGEVPRATQFSQPPSNRKFPTYETLKAPTAHAPESYWVTELSRSAMHAPVPFYQINSSARPPPLIPVSPLPPKYQPDPLQSNPTVHTVTNSIAALALQLLSIVYPFCPTQL